MLALVAIRFSPSGKSVYYLLSKYLNVILGGGCKGCRVLSFMGR